MEWNPGKLMAVSGGHWQTATLHAGVVLDVFSIIGDDGGTGAQIAQQTDADKAALTRLLDALTAMDLLKKSGDVYANTPFSGKFLSRHSPAYMGYIVQHHQNLVDSFNRLPEAVRSGKPVRARPADDENRRENFLMGMFNLAMGLAPGMVKEIGLGGRTSLLDLGGGPGTWAIHFCKENPGMQATVFDLPTTRPFAEKTIRMFDMAERVSFADGDFNQVEIPGKYDAAWLSHIMHGENPDECRRLIAKTAACLEPGGIILIHDFILEDHRTAPLFAALFSLNMMLGTSGGRSYTEGELAEILTDTGFKDIQRIAVTSPNESGVLSGIRR